MIFTFYFPTDYYTAAKIFQNLMPMSSISTSYETRYIDAHPAAHEALSSANDGSNLSDSLRLPICSLFHPDKKNLEPEHYDGFDVKVHSRNDGTQFAITAPTAVWQSTRMDRLTRNCSALAVGVCIPIHIEGAHTREGISRVLTLSKQIHADEKGMETANVNELSIVFQGGASIADAEYKFAKEVGSFIRKNSDLPLHFITGGGRGIMRAPHSGAKQAEGLSATSSGISCMSIIESEPANSLIDRLTVFQQMEARLEAFARSGNLTVLFPGGVGTLEELLYVLTVRMHKNNVGIHYPYLLVGSEESRHYYEMLFESLNQILGKEAMDQGGLNQNLCIGSPEQVAARILKEATAAKDIRAKEVQDASKFPFTTLDFHGDIHIPEGMRTPFTVTRNAVASLSLVKHKEPAKTATELRRLVHSVIGACVYPSVKREIEKNGPFAVHGNKQNFEAFTNLMEHYASTGRMNGGTYRNPFQYAGASPPLTQ